SPPRVAPARVLSRLHDPVGERAELLRPVRGDQEVVLEAEAAAVVPVAAWLDCKDHALGDLAARRLVRIRRLVSPGADPLADRMRRLAGIPDTPESLADPAVELGEPRSWDAERDRVVVDLAETGLE